MFKIENLAQAQKLLEKYVPAVLNVTGKDITLDRMRPLMDRLGNPQDKLKIVHVAGTSGKTSVCYYTSSLLTTAGFNTGLTVSPHIDLVTERLQVNTQPVRDEEFCSALEEFMNLIADLNPEPTYFEILMALAYWYFARIGIDYAVIETGLGGLHDASNVAQREDKVCVITDIGYDHIKILGDSLDKIAFQKAGIIHKNNQVFVYEQGEEVMNVIKKAVRENSATLNLLSDNYEIPETLNSQFNNLPLYQQRNWYLAYRSVRYLEVRDNFEITDDKLAKTFHQYIPGRMEIVYKDGKQIIMDGAHNEQKISRFTESFKQKFPKRKATVVLSMKRDKDYLSVIPLLRPITEELIITSFDMKQDFPLKSEDPEVIASKARELGMENITVISDPNEAFNEVMKSQADLIVITGSFYLIAGLHQAILKS